MPNKGEATKTGGIAKRNETASPIGLYEQQQTGPSDETNLAQRKQSLKRPSKEWIRQGPKPQGP
jgi:hypothetical protein